MVSSLSAQIRVCLPADDLLRATWRGQQLADRVAECRAGRAPHPPRSQSRHLDAGPHACQASPADVQQLCQAYHQRPLAWPCPVLPLLRLLLLSTAGSLRRLTSHLCEGIGRRLPDLLQGTCIQT